MADLLARLLGANNPAQQDTLIAEHLAQLDVAFVATLKDVAGDFLRADVNRSLSVCDLMLRIANATGCPYQRALGLLAKANALSLGGLGEYTQALDLYNEAAAIYAAAGRRRDQAAAQVGKILALANLGRYDEAVAAGEWAAQTLQACGEPLLVAKITANLGNVAFRRGHDPAALGYFERASAAYGELTGNEEAVKARARVDNNRATVLRNLGRFSEAIAASAAVRATLVRTAQAAEVARCDQNLAVTYYILGRYNEALALLAQALAFYEADGRPRDAILAELFRSNCLLQLRAFDEVLEKTRQAQDLFARFGTRFEVAQALLNEATAYAGLARGDEALAALARAREVFAAEGNLSWTALADLETAAMLGQLGRHEESLARATAAGEALRSQGLPVEEAQARLTAARAALALGFYAEAADHAEAARRVGAESDLPSLLFPCYRIRAALAEQARGPEEALRELDAALAQLERLRRQLMVEHRADFQEDKQVVYEDAVALCLRLDRPEQGLQYAERARSRALLEMLDFRLNIGIRARSTADEPVVAELLKLRAERDQLYRRWEGGREVKVRGWTSPDGEQQVVQGQVLAIEKRIKTLWQSLLVRNADYAAEGVLLGQGVNSADLPDLPPDALFLEYFVARGQLVAFLAQGGNVRAHALPAQPADVERLLRLWQLNLQGAMGRSPEDNLNLTPNATGILRKLHDALLRPLEEREGRLFEQCRSWVVAPCGSLHYLPFHALHDGRGYLAERAQISYAPSAGILKHTAARRTADGRSLAFGLSQRGQLPHAVAEAEQVAALLRGDARVEDDATVAALVEAGDAPVLHLATHGEFRSDNPLFSGLSLADGWLTTLDIFGLRLRASLVTLSACQTGRSVVGGGEELLGLARAFLSAGAASLLLSYWAVEDRSTAEFMAAFYTSLAQGETKAAALQAAQARLLDDDRYAHPYYWAPFALIGDTGALRLHPERKAPHA
jgi:tetratricopeptide (TPR) repeat protein